MDPRTLRGSMHRSGRQGRAIARLRWPGIRMAGTPGRPGAKWRAPEKGCVTIGVTSCVTFALWLRDTCATKMLATKISIRLLGENVTHLASICHASKGRKKSGLDGILRGKSTPGWNLRRRAEAGPVLPGGEGVMICDDLWRLGRRLLDHYVA